MRKPLTKTVTLGLFGLGTVGSGVVKILQSEAKRLEKKTGIRLVLKRVCVKSQAKKRPVKVARSVFTTDAAKILKDPSIDIIVELIGGLHPAKEIVMKAFAEGKHVVTANKALLAEEGKAVFAAAGKYGKRLGFEASVCGGIPIIKSLKEGLASNNVSSFFGIVNGTCNFILTGMSTKGLDFKTALADAQKRGYAERDPRFDIEGIDSAHKLAVLARLAFRAEVPFKRIHVEGISKLSALDIAYAKELGYVIKLLAIGKKLDSGLELRVHPTMLPFDHPLSNVRGVYNAVFVHSDQAGDLLFYGRGAGMMPTASAVMSDVLDIAKRMQNEPFGSGAMPLEAAKASVLPIGTIVSKYYLRFQVADKPGVLGRIAQTLGKNNISILSVHQKESHGPTSVPVVILTYEAQEANLRKALKEIDSQKWISQKTVVMRVEK
ncbi:MAG TPA: homoserine dehydrogenase [Candidatus Eisenbacteria bacterium]|nr:homoserine dehydrogenase [Candidatus Eisenbacteria bacterium]